jgi:hypothetical protein
MLRQQLQCAFFATWPKQPDKGLKIAGEELFQCRRNLTGNTPEQLNNPAHWAIVWLPELI